MKQKDHIENDGMSYVGKKKKTTTVSAEKKKNITKNKRNHYKWQTFKNISFAFLLKEKLNDIAHNVVTIKTSI